MVLQNCTLTISYMNCLKITAKNDMFIDFSSVLRLYPILLYLFTVQKLRATARNFEINTLLDTIIN